MIRNTHERNSRGVLSAYRDNAAVIEAGPATRLFAPDRATADYADVDEPIDIVMKVETHNHPTAISPFAGAATGSGGEIRDEGATGRGAKPKAGLVGFTVSNLRIPGFEQPWEQDHGKPGRIASALDIMLEGPIGAAAFNNEFGRPNISGYFRTYEQRVEAPGRAPLGLSQADHDCGRPRQHPPFARRQVRGKPVRTSSCWVARDVDWTRRRRRVVGDAGSSSADLDFASVQRGNPEMQRRAQEVIDALLGDRLTQSDSARPRRRRRRSCECDSRVGALRHAVAESTCARCRATSPACRRSNSGATKRRSATSS